MHSPWPKKAVHCSDTEICMCKLLKLHLLLSLVLTCVLTHHVWRGVKWGHGVQRVGVGGGRQIPENQLRRCGGEEPSSTHTPLHPSSPLYKDTGQHHICALKSCQGKVRFSDMIPLFNTRGRSCTELHKFQTLLVCFLWFFSHLQHERYTESFLNNFKMLLTQAF